MNAQNKSPLTTPPAGTKPLTPTEYNAKLQSLKKGVGDLETAIRAFIENQKKEERITDLGGRIYDIAVPGGKGKPEIHPVFENIMKMRGEMMAHEGLEKRSKALAKEQDTIADDFDTSRLEKLSGDPAFIKKLLRQEDYEEEFKKRYKSARLRNEMYRDDYKGKKTKEQLKAEVDEKLMADYKENRERVANQLSKLYEEMALYKPSKYGEDIQTEWFDALDTHEYPEEITRDIIELGGDAETVEDDEGNDMGRSYRTYERDVYIPKNSTTKLIYRHTTEVLTRVRDEDGNWDFSGEVEEDDVTYDDERGYYLVPK